MVTDEYISGLFEGRASFGKTIDESAQLQRKELKKNLKNQLDGYWTGHTAYHILIDGGFLKDGKRGTKKQATELGKLLLAS